GQLRLLEDLCTCDDHRTHYPRDSRSDGIVRQQDGPCDRAYGGAARQTDLGAALRADDVLGGLGCAGEIRPAASTHPRASADRRAIYANGVPAETLWQGFVRLALELATPTAGHTFA